MSDLFYRVDWKLYGYIYYDKCWKGNSAFILQKARFFSELVGLYKHGGIFVS